MANKKTFDVAQFKDWTNEQLSRTDNFALEGNFKQGLCVALESVLTKTGNYKGYMDNYWNETGCELWNNSGKTEDWKQKEVFIYGDSSTKYKGNKYSRFYY
jgi:hypothetical protein